MVEVMKIKVTSFKRSQARTAARCPQPCSRPLPTRVSARDSWTFMDTKSILPMFSSRSFTVSGLKSLIHFEFTFVHGVRVVQFYQHHLVYILTAIVSSISLCSNWPGDSA